MEQAEKYKELREFIDEFFALKAKAEALELSMVLNFMNGATKFLGDDIGNYWRRMITKENEIYPGSVSQLAHEYCNEMIDNLRHNVSERKTKIKSNRPT